MGSNREHLAQQEVERLERLVTARQVSALLARHEEDVQRRRAKVAKAQQKLAAARKRLEEVLG